MQHRNAYSRAARGRPRFPVIFKYHIKIVQGLFLAMLVNLLLPD